MSAGNSFTWTTTSDEVVKAYADSVKGRTFLVTGAGAQSLGGEAAIALARNASPAQLILPGRSLNTLSPVIDEIKAINKDVKVYYVPLDLGDPSSTRRAAEDILNNPEIEKIDVVINCAGVMGTPYTQTAYKDKDGKPLELQFSVNHLGHFLFTSIIFQKVRKAAPGARIVNVTSSGHNFSGIKFDDLGFSAGAKYDVIDAYGQSKTANILMARYLADNIPSKEIASFAVHPGGILETRLARFQAETGFIQQAVERMKNMPNVDPDPMQHLKTIPQGASTILVAALDPSIEAQSGAYLDDCQIGTAAEYAQNKESSEKLWKLSEEIVGQKFSVSI
ncbi:retinol dehydrogenase 13 [Paecilomyces variotii No. 5]|uniref:Retinol dehydrogenase 13 n=1 Tax=Byssochlamys spectabilis (strain No. 5 / NBRC 109023) TaxID=1356009 RepID=V5FD66_BYSSN|nr:retinol dehydrogenase 13 [Paecilomyces variotii No. 5]